MLEKGEIHASIAVLQFPPKDSLSNRVSLLYLKGTCTLLLPSASIWIQLPNVSSDLFILAPSVSRVPFAPPALSEPAKSTRLNFPILTSSLIPLAFYLVYALTMRRAWERDDASFDPVASFDRFAAPTLSRVANSIREFILI